MRPLLRALASVLVSIPLIAAAAEGGGLVAVLPLDARLANVDEATRQALDEAVRSVSGNALSPLGYTVLTGDTTLAVLRDNGIDAAKACEASCALEAARELHAKVFVSGLVTRTEGELVAYLRLYEIEAGRQLSSVQLEGRTVKELRQQLAQRADALFAPLTKGAPAAPRGVGGLGVLAPGTVHLQLSPAAAAALDGRRVEAELVVDGHATRCPNVLSGERACRFTDVPSGGVAWQLLVDGQVEGAGTLAVGGSGRLDLKLEPRFGSGACFGTAVAGVAMTVAGFALGSAEGGLGKESAGPVLLVAFGLPVLIGGLSAGIAIETMWAYEVQLLQPVEPRTSVFTSVSLKR